MRILLFLIASVACAQPVILQGPYVGGISHSGAVLSMATDVASYNDHIKWAYDSPSLAGPACPTAAPVCYFDQPTTIVGGNVPVFIHSWFISGANSNVVIHYQYCTATTSEVCSPEATFTTTDPPQIPMDPTPPAQVDAPVVPSGTVRTVGADCDDGTTGLQALWSASSPGDIVEIDPTVTKYCVGLYQYPHKSGPPYILTRAKDAATTWPDYRRTNPADKPKMARFIQSGMNILKTGTDPSTFICFYQSYSFWVGRWPSHFPIYKCGNVLSRSITAIPSSGDLNITVPSHGYTDRFMTHIAGVTGPGAATLNDDFLIYVIDANTLQLHHYIDTGPVQATGAASGGTIWMDQASALSYTPFSGAPPSTCTWGDWYLKTDAADEYHAPYYCNNTNELIPYRVDLLSGFTPFTTFDLTTNNAQYAMFQGLSFEPLNLKGDGTPPQYQYGGATEPYGLTAGYFVAQGAGTNHIYWDNTLAMCPDPSPTGFFGKCIGWAIDLSGTSWHVGNGYFAGFQTYESYNATYDGSAFVMAIYHTGPHEIVNNYIGCAGICVFYPDDDASTSYATDATFKQNVIEAPNKYFYPSSDWLGNGMYWSDRHRFEAKRLKRGIIEGNIFRYGWVWNNSAAAVCLCTRGGAGGAQMSSLDSTGPNTVVTIYPAVNNSHGYVFQSVTPGSLVTFTAAYAPCASLVNQIFTVLDSPTPQTIRLNSNLGCTNTSGLVGNIIQLNSPSNYITDQLIRYNTFLDSPTDNYNLGHDSYAGPPYSLVSAAMQRVKFQHNLSVGLNGNRIGGINTSPTNYGDHINALIGIEDFQISHHTVVGMQTGSIYDFAVYANYAQPVSYRSAMSSGFKFNDSIFEDLNSVAPNNIGMWFEQLTYFGQAALDNAFSGGRGVQYTALNNVVQRPNGATGIVHPYTSSTFFFDSNSGAFPYYNPATSGGDYHIVPASIYASGGTARASDGLNQGADINALIIAQGQVLDVRAYHVTSSTASVGFTASDARGCTVDWGTDPTFITYTRAANAGGSRAQHVDLSVSTGTHYYYRVNCRAYQPTGDFITP